MESQFNSMASITFVHCPKVKLIGKNAFKSCYALKRFYSKCLTEIGNSSFYGCISLSEIDVSKIIKLDESAFAFC